MNEKDKENKKINFEELVMLFAIASILGFIIETVSVLLVYGKLTKRGFLFGPYCPIYGFGALILYVTFYKVKRTKKNIPLVFIISALLMGSFELLSGLFFKHAFNIELWNYSGRFLNILNYTTVPLIIAWGLLGTFYVYIIHPAVLKLLKKIPRKIMRILVISFLCIYITDNIVSVIRIIHNPHVLDRLL